MLKIIGELAPEAKPRFTPAVINVLFLTVKWSKMLVLGIKWKMYYERV